MNNVDLGGVFLMPHHSMMWEVVNASSDKGCLEGVNVLNNFKTELL